MNKKKFEKLKAKVQGNLYFKYISNNLLLKSLILEKKFLINFATSVIIVNLAVESSSDEDEESSEDEKMETETAEKEPEAPKKGEKFRSGYGSD